MFLMRNDLKDQIIGLKVSATVVEKRDGTRWPSFSFIEGFPVKEILGLALVEESGEIGIDLQLRAASGKTELKGGVLKFTVCV